MKTQHTMLISLFTVVTMLFTFTPAQAAEMDVVSALNLSEAQLEQLGDTIVEFGEKALDLGSELDKEFMELEQELAKDDRLDSNRKAKKSADFVNTRIERIGARYLELLTLRVEYLLKAKNVLTGEQKLLMLEALLDFEINVPEEFSPYIELDIIPLGVELSTEQLKQLLEYKAKMETADVGFELDLAYQLLDLRDAILAEEWDSEQADGIVMAVADIGAKGIENHVDYILKAKDVLSLEQKRTLSHLLMISNY